eukprot:2678848-Pyramimonas_sp.AAC.1
MRFHEVSRPILLALGWRTQLWTRLNYDCHARRPHLETERASQSVVNGSTSAHRKSAAVSAQIGGKGPRYNFQQMRLSSACAIPNARMQASVPNSAPEMRIPCSRA